MFRTVAAIPARGDAQPRSSHWPSACTKRRSNSPPGDNRMWNKREDGTPQTTQPQPTTRTVVSTPPPAGVSARSMAVIGASMEIKGEIRSREELMVEGDVEG